MSKSALLPHIHDGIARMGAEEAFSFVAQLSAAMIAGVALLFAGLNKSHPVRRCADELVAMMPHGEHKALRTTLADIIGLLEVAGTTIWRLEQFQPDGELRVNPLQLVEFVCQPAESAAEPRSRQSKGGRGAAS